MYYDKNHSPRIASRVPRKNIQEKLDYIKQNSKFLEYKKGINQESLHFVLHRNRDEWNISDTKYMNLLNYYLTQRAEVNNQLRINEKIITLLELELLFGRLAQAHNTFLSFNIHCKKGIDTLHSLS
jgi:hypothetical protein